MAAFQFQMFADRRNCKTLEREQENAAEHPGEVAKHLRWESHWDRDPRWSLEALCNRQNLLATFLTSSLKIVRGQVCLTRNLEKDMMLQLCNEKETLQFVIHLLAAKEMAAHFLLLGR